MKILNNKNFTNLKTTRDYKPKKPERGIYSEMHALAKDVSEYFGEPKKFAMYLGIIKNIGLRRAYQIFAEIKETAKGKGRNIKTPGKLFVYMSAYKKSRSEKNGNKKRTR